VGLGDLFFFAARGGFGNSSSLCTAGSFDTLGGGSASCLFGLAQRALRGGIGITGLENPRGFDCTAFGGIGGIRSGFSFSLGKQRLLAYLLCRTMSQLRTVLAARCREVAIFRSMQIRPRVENSHIFRSLRDYELIAFICAASIHHSKPRALLQLRCGS
jgi:hypothetical protein